MSRSRSAVLLVASVLASGCGARGADRPATNVLNGALIGGGSLMTVAGVALLSLDEPHGDDGISQSPLYALAPLGIALAIAGSAGFFQSYADDEPAAPPPPLAEAAPPRGHRRRA